MLTAADFPRYAPPTSSLRVLTVPPALASWDKRGSRSQERLSAFLDHVQTVTSAESGSGDLAVELCVDLPAGASLVDGGYDLDNFLYPVINRLDRRRFVSASATKGYLGQSTIRIGPTAVVPLGPGWSFAAAETAGSTAKKAWKTELARALSPLPQLAADGPLELEVAFVTSGRRNWTWLWKPAIDSLEAIVGRSAGAAEFNTRDDRITRLAMHRRVDENLGWHVRVGVWWRAAAIAGPHDREVAPTWG